MKEKIIVASNNQHKIIEIKQILKDFEFDIVSLKEVGIDVDVEENGTTFMENAYIKASTIYKLCNGKAYVMADDSGLMVDALDGAPGVYSARFAGEHGNDEKNNEKLLRLLHDVPYEKRTAKFVCAIVLILGEDKIIKVQGETKGYILNNSTGKDGFGYDPLFYYPEYDKTFAEMSSSQKNAISHRGKALDDLKIEIKKLIQGE